MMTAPPGAPGTGKPRMVDPQERAGFRAQLAERLSAARAAYTADARRGSAGREVLELHADRMDGLLRDITGAAGAPAATTAVVCAVGGYGRRALCLHSDIDMLIVTADAIDAAAERFINALLQPLWDLRLSVGQHVRELADFDAIDLDNPELLLALLDLRYVAGDVGLYAEVVARLDAGRAALVPHCLAALLNLTDVRHARFNHTIYQLEPDVKDAPGALRDLEALRLMRLLRPDAFQADAVALGGRARDAEDFLFRVRSVLHATTGRSSNLLSHALQEVVAEAMGCEGTSAQQRVEALMSDYFRWARPVARSLARSRTALEPAAGPIVPRAAGRYLEIAEDGLRFVDPDRVAAMPTMWLEAFRIALVEGCGLSEQARTCIEENVSRYTADDFVATEGDRRQLLALLVPRPGLYARLSEMHDCGLLGCIFPEFARIQSRVIRDFYHRFTVDEHTLLTIRNIEGLCGADVQGRERFATMLTEVHAPELLVLALLYHDVGKWRDEEHAAESVVMAQPMMERLQLGSEARQTVSFLIEQHLAMSRVAFLRDSEDPEVVSRFAAVVRSEDQLKMLCLITWADIGAVSPETLTPWKEELLWRLYVDTYNRLTYGYADDLIQMDHAGLEVVVAGRPADISESELWAFLDGLPRRYLALFGLATVYRHVRLARDITPDDVHASLEKHADIWELSVVTLDRPFLFSNISGVLSYFGMDIHRAQAMTTPAGLVLDIFQFSDLEQFLAQNAAGAAEIYRVLQAVVSGAADVTDLLRGKERSVLYRRREPLQPVIHVDHEHSEKYTVLEIVADDAIGLLYRISRGLSRLGCDLDLALISTEGKKAIDVLHVTKGGNKLSFADEAAIRQELGRMLEGTDEAD
jgi:[protein-PII] uridylyltransferase